MGTSGQTERFGSDIPTKRAPGTRSAQDGRVGLLSAVSVPFRPVDRLRPVIGAERYHQLVAAAAGIRDALGRRTVWNVNSTAAGGGVAEMLQGLVGYVEDLAIPIRWTVIGG